MKLKFDWDWAGSNFFVTNSKKEWLGNIYWHSELKSWVWQQKKLVLLLEECLELFKFVKDCEKKYPKSLMMKRNKIMKAQAKKWREGMAT